MKNNISTILLLSFCFVSFGQDDSRSTFKKIKKAKGAIKVEEFYPVQINALQDQLIYLDSNLKVTKRNFTDEKYAIRMSKAFGWYPIAKLPKKKPINFQIDSTITISNTDFSLSKSNLQIINATITYRWRFSKRVIYRIHDGNIEYISLTDKKNRLLGGFDFEGLRKDENGYWPVLKRWNKKGKLKFTRTDYYVNGQVYQFVWR